MALRPRFDDDGKRASYKSVIRKGHPLAGASGRIRLCRLVLYGKIGPGEHPCTWCGLILSWGKTQKDSPRALLADHLDGDPNNDSAANIVPSCNTCNCRRGLPNRIQPGETCVKVCGGWRRAVEISCFGCNKMFLSAVTAKLVPTRKYCSPGCFSKYGSRNGVIAMQKARRIPADDHQKIEGKSSRRTVPYFCNHCKKEYYNIPRRGGRLYCSKSCYMGAKRVAAGFPADIQVEIVNKMRRGVERRECAYCGSEFAFTIMSHRFNAGKYCSISCGNKNRSRKISE